jgi:uncharacterized membrane protein YgdD (TMEM256/DUF423 family)
MTLQPLAKRAWALGTLTLALAVLMGAFGAHGLKSMVSPEKLITFETGIRYQFYHGFGILILAAFHQLYGVKKMSMILHSFLAGILLFSFNCYLYVLTDIKTFAMIVPVGGVLFVLGWILFFWNALKLR